MKLLYWAGIGVVVYAYLGYGLLVALLAWLRPRRARPAPITPGVTIVVPCYNEAAYIAAKLDNCLEQDYPADRLEVLVIVSGSDDGTEKIVRT